ncbi:hypothetical protein ACFXJ5_39935 [Streptomyces sp. NPDC059373]
MRYVRILLAAALLGASLLLPGTAGVAAADTTPTVAVSPKQAGAGGDITVTGKGWKPGTLLTLLICGQNAIGGTNSCANSSGRAVTTDARGAFKRKLPVAEPPKPCPCVVHVATVMGDSVAVDAAFVVAGHPVAALPKQTTGGRLAVLTARLEGSGGLLTWFGAPPQRQLVITVGNLGSAPAKDPVFQVGTAHGVFAPQWEEQAWQGTVPSGRKQQIKLPVELAAGAHGDYTVSLKYGGKILVTEPWPVSRPWGVTLFWILLCVVVPSALFRIGMAVVDRLRPRSGPGPRGAHRPQRQPVPATAPPAPVSAPNGAPTLPWFTPGVLSQPPTPSDDVQRKEPRS